MKGGVIKNDIFVNLIILLSEPPADPVLPSEQHLSVLTDYVSFLEG